ncbi:MAG: hypothetical protein AVO35_11885 [Candidatus Aegiribacteria sp. MLS_C]|nr:MAG: hypothetical protein AVO35_11885 [Candidatus Aegiribacteria sp. MLS_C]
MEYTLDHVRPLRIGAEAAKEILECMRDLHPELRKLLDAELEAGNRVTDASRDWPDEGSIFLTMSGPFRTGYDRAGPLRYNEPGDPHYWTADYSCGDPLHIVAY